MVAVVQPPATQFLERGLELARVVPEIVRAMVAELGEEPVDVDVGQREPRPVVGAIHGRIVARPSLYLEMRP